MCDWLFATAKRLNLFVAGENELTITTMTAPRPLGRNGALLAAFCLSFAAMSALGLSESTLRSRLKRLGLKS